MSMYLIFFVHFNYGVNKDQFEKSCEITWENTSSHKQPDNQTSFHVAIKMVTTDQTK